MKSKARLLDHWPIAIALAYLIIPIQGWGFLSAGRPLTLLGAVAVGATSWLWWSRRRLPFATLLVIALGVKLVSMPVIPPRGFQAAYYAQADWRGPVEAGTSGAPTFTRVDERLQFGGEHRDLPLSFFNSTGRFNFYQPGEPQRDRLAFSVLWHGFRYQPSAEERQLYVVAPGSIARVTIGEAPPITITNAGPDWSTRALLPTGWQPIQVDLSSPYGAPRRFEVGWLANGRREPLDASQIFQHPVGAWRITGDRLLRAGAWLFDALWLAALLFNVIDTLKLAVRASREPDAPATLAHPWSTLIVAIVLVDAALFALPAVNRLVLLGGGGDPLAYETMARDIAIGGPLMTGGEVLGHGFPYYYHPFYPYFLAICHWLTGEGMFGIYFIQRFLLGIAVIWLWRTTALLFGESTGRVGLIVAGVVVYERIAVWAGVLLSDVLFLPLLCGWSALLVGLACGRTRRPAVVVAAGVVWGVAILTRGTPLLGMLLVLPVFVVAIARRSGTWWRPTLLLVATMLAVVSLATARNYIVAGRFVPIFGSGSASLILGNPPPAIVRLAPGPRDAFYHRFGIEDTTRAVVEYAMQAPATFVRGLLSKALYMLGWFDALVPGAGWSSFLIACWVAAAGGALLLAFGYAESPHSAATSALPAAVASVHVVSAIVIFPHVYGDRLILPIYAVIVPYVAITVAAACRVAARASRASLMRALICAALALCVWEVALPVRIGFDFDLLFPLMLVGALALGARFDRGHPPWAFATLAVALSVTLLSVPTADAVVEYRRQLAVLALAMVIAPMATSARTRRIVVTVLIAMVAAVAIAAAATASVTRAVVTIMAAAAVVWLAIRPRPREHWTSAIVLAGAAMLTVVAFEWVSRSVTTLDDGLSLYAWQWIGGERSVLAGHEWFGIGLSGAPALAGIRQSTVGAGGGVLWFLVGTGFVGAICYVAVWIRSLWISAGPQVDQGTIALQGVLLAIFAVSQRHNLLAGPTGSAALLALVGITFGLVQATTYVSTDDIEPLHP